MTAERKELLIAALVGFKHTMRQFGERMTAIENELRGKSKPRRLSAAGRRRISAASRKRWAEFREQRAVESAYATLEADRAAR